jgi:hypothetical protein
MSKQINLGKKGGGKESYRNHSKTILRNFSSQNATTQMHPLSGAFFVCCLPGKKSFMEV